ncbi:MAG: hypothetical protein SD837_08720 [Candidatus Electrothrix scaldis]|nr:MAG: hypothetical protein SD837_08720 [Candidatus Electrothrix sp. GW3-3]
MYENKNVFLGIYTDADSKLITSFRLSDKSFNSEGILPSINGITIGSTRELLLKQFGEPLFKDEHMGCPYNLHKEPNYTDVDAVTYYYNGISFWVCTENDLIYLIDIKPNKANPADAKKQRG